MPFLSIQLLKELLQLFHLTYSLSSFLFITLTLNFLICFLQFFFVKRSNNFFAFKVTNNICPHYSVLTVLITKTSSNQFGTWSFANMFLYFDILTISPTLNLVYLSLISLLESVSQHLHVQFITCTKS